MKNFVKVIIIFTFIAQISFSETPKSLSGLPEPLKRALFSAFEDQFLRTFTKLDPYQYYPGYKNDSVYWALASWTYLKEPCLSLLNNNWANWELVKEGNYKLPPNNEEVTIYAYKGSFYSSDEFKVYGHMRVYNCNIRNALAKPGELDFGGVGFVAPKNAPLTEAYKVFFGRGTMCFCNNEHIWGP